MFYMGLDLGQSADYTALCILERKPQTAYDDHGWAREAPPRYHVRHLERFPLGELYPAMVQRVIDRMSAPVLKGRTSLVVDATGVGRPVVDLLKGANLHPIAVTITGGDMVTSNIMGGYSVPKRDLVSALQVLLQTGRLEVAGGLKLASTFLKEMTSFKVRISAGGHDSYGNDWRENPHDDLVLSVALAAWYAERQGIGPRSRTRRAA